VLDFKHGVEYVRLFRCIAKEIKMFSPKVFTEILNISISATLLIAVCFLVRTVFRKMPKYIRCLMWLLVFVRLAIPFSIESNLSVLPTK